METPKILTKNKYGITIVKCCASCKYRTLDNRTRICTAGEGVVPSSYLCGGWVMNPKYENVGRGGGKVKRYDYLQYILNRLEAEQTASIVAANKGYLYRRSSIEEIRADFTKDLGKININDK